MIRLVYQSVQDVATHQLQGTWWSHLDLEARTTCEDDQNHFALRQTAPDFHKRHDQRKASCQHLLTRHRKCLLSSSSNGKAVVLHRGSQADQIEV